MKRFFYTLLIIIVLAPFLLCGGFYWLMGGGFGYIADWKMQRAFNLYLDTQWLGDSVGYCCYGSGERIQYYWTPDNLPDVKTHYASFTTLPFVENRTIYHPDGKKPSWRQYYYLVTRNQEKAMYDHRQCHFGQIETCIQLQLYDLTKRKYHVANHLSLEKIPTSGTLIAYSYHLSDDMNPFLKGD